MIKKAQKIVVLLFFLVSMVASHAFAGVTGKIVGYVKDKNTGEPLQGVNVIIEGRMLGAASNNTGYYFIVNVPPGSYTLKAQMMGYKTCVIKKVLVIADLTTTVNSDLVPTVLVGEEVVVTAERPLVQVDITAKMSIVTKDQIDLMPIENIREILSILPGFTDASHLRGGRGNEIAYMIDGMYVSDPLYGTFDGLLIDKDIVEELVVMSGTFNAEYGNAMSGVVNVITKDPAPEFHGKLEYLSLMVNESPYQSYRIENGKRINIGTGVEDSNPHGLEYEPWKISDHFAGWDKRNILGQFRGNLSGAVPLIKGLTFFLSGRYLNENSYLPFGYDLQREGMGKLIYRITPDMKLSLMVQRTQNYYQPYSHSWKYRPDHYSRFERFTNLENLVFTHTLSTSTFYTIRASRYKQTFDRRVEDKEIDIDSILKAEGGDTTVTPQTDYGKPVVWSQEFIYLGDDPYYVKETTRTLGGKVDITSQINKHHQIKAGIEMTRHKLDRFWFEEPWLGGVHQYQDYRRQPLEFASYIQDKIEYNYVILNLGLRLDYFDPTAMMWPYIYNPGFVDTTGKFQYYPEEEVPAKWQISPRIGLAHPVTDRMVLHFAYGHFFQRPDYRHMYYLHDIRTLPYFEAAGNPSIKAQSADAFEVGVKQQIGKYFAADFAIYYKIITDLAGSSYQSYFPYPFAVYDNSDYASAKGFEISLEKRYSHYFSGNLNYTWLVAMGNENTAKEGSALYWGDTKNRLRPRREFPLNWDRRHTFGLNINFRIPADKGPEIWGIKPLANLGANLLVSIKSGLPYTPEVLYYPELERAMIRNSARKPWTARADLQARKNFELLGLTYSAFVKVINLFDTKNVLWVYPLTGKPWDAGPITTLSEDYQRNPSVYEAPRQVRVGVSIRW